MTGQQPPPGGFSLFPSTSAGPSRRTTPRPQVVTHIPKSAATTHEGDARPSPYDATAVHAVSTAGPYNESPSTLASPPRATPQTPQQRMGSPINHQQHATISPDTRQSPISRIETATEVSYHPPAEMPIRTDTAFSEARTLVREESTRSRSSIAKRPLPEDGSPADYSAQPIRSIFPQYNPDVPLNHQEYFPTQLSPTHIPRAVISRPLYSPEPEPETAGMASAGLRSPFSGTSAPPSHWPPRANEPAVMPPVSSTDMLRALWKTTNGWQASDSEGRVFCLRMKQENDAPVYTLSSSSNQPFYRFRLDPTSASANVTLSRHDPAKQCRTPTPPLAGGSSILGGRSDSGSAKVSEGKGWVKALGTKLEEESRKHRPNDGLVAELMPTGATRIAAQHPDYDTAQMMANRERARLVWDDDSKVHFLVHPSLATPFCITIERSPAWSRTEYTLEHHESPQHMARLTRDGAGTGWLEVDTLVAAQAAAYYLIDVAVAALLIVAATDATSVAEAFEPPPILEPPRAVLGGSSRSSSRVSAVIGAGSAGGRRKKREMDEFDVDIESQNSLGKTEGRTRDKMPFWARALFKVAGGLFKAFLWCLTLVLKCFVLIFVGLLRCVGLK